jgi:hypothetical protein
LLFFRLIEKAGLVVQNIAVFLAGLTEPSSLGIGKDLVRVLQLPLQLVNFRFAMVSARGRMSSATSATVYVLFLSAAAITHTPEK